MHLDIASKNMGELGSVTGRNGKLLRTKSIYKGGSEESWRETFYQGLQQQDKEQSF